MAIALVVGISNAAAAGGWSGQFSGTTKALRAVSFVNDNDGWAVGDSGTILATTDGGQNWSSQSSGTTNDPLGVSFVDASHGWAVGGNRALGGAGTILVTSDGGTTWSAQTAASSATLFGVSFVDQTHGWAVGQGGAIEATSDGGASWSEQSSPTTNFLNGVSFVDQNHGVAVGDNSGSSTPGVIVATNNGGATWEVESPGIATGDLQSVSFVDQNHGWAVGFGQTILATSDEGVHWTAQTPGVGIDLWGVSFVDQNHGWAVGDTGVGDPYVLATSDGGADWSTQFSDSHITTGAPLAVSAVDPYHAWAVGILSAIPSAGTILGYVAPAPALGLSTTTINFGSQLVGTTTAAQTVTITNTAGAGGQPLQIGQLSLGGENSGDFSLANDSCSNSAVAGGASCTVDLSFSPEQPGARNASLNVPSNAASSPDHVALSGTGVASADVSVAISGPTSAKRGAQISYLITVSNAGPSAAHNVVMSEPLPAGASFVAANTTRGSCKTPKSGATSGTISCTLGDLASSSSAGNTISVKLTAKAGSTITNTASAASTANTAGTATADPDTSNNWAALTTAVTK